MARKNVVNKEVLLEGAFELLKENGKNGISARVLSARCGCSTQPIFRLYSGMEELYEDLFKMSIDFFSDFYKKAPKNSDTPFVDLGMTYIRFAGLYPNVFRYIFLDDNKSGKSMYELVNGGSEEFVMHEISRLKGMSSEESGVMFMKMWIFIHGIACMVIKDDFDMTDREIEELLISTYDAFAGGSGKAGCNE